MYAEISQFYKKYQGALEPKSQRTQELYEKVQRNLNPKRYLAMEDRSLSTHALDGFGANQFNKAAHDAQSFIRNASSKSFVLSEMGYGPSLHERSTTPQELRANMELSMRQQDLGTKKSQFDAGFSQKLRNQGASQVGSGKGDKEEIEGENWLGSQYIFNGNCLKNGLSENFFQKDEKNSLESRVLRDMINRSSTPGPTMRESQNESKGKRTGSIQGENSKNMENNSGARFEIIPKTVSLSKLLQFQKENVHKNQQKYKEAILERTHQREQAVQETQKRNDDSEEVQAEKTRKTMKQQLIQKENEVKEIAKNLKQKHEARFNLLNEMVREESFCLSKFSKNETFTELLNEFSKSRTQEANQREMTGEAPRKKENSPSYFSFEMHAANNNSPSFPGNLNSHFQMALGFLREMQSENPERHIPQRIRRLL